MGLASRPSHGARPAELRGVGIIDVIEMKESLRVGHAPGVVAVLDAFPAEDARAFLGRSVRLRAPSGRAVAAKVEGIRDHGTTISLFFRGLTPADLPAGSRIEFDGETPT